MKYEYKHLAVKPEIHNLAKQKASNKGMFVNKYVAELILNDVKK